VTATDRLKAAVIEELESVLRDPKWDQIRLVVRRVKGEWEVVTEPKRERRV